MSITEQAPVTDRDVVVDILRRTGPRSLRSLRSEGHLSRWPAERVEGAVVQAWSDDRLSIDVEDPLIAL